MERSSSRTTPPTPTDAGGAAIPVHLFFSDRAYARRVAVEEWSDRQPHELSLDVLLTEVLPELAARGDRVGSNFQEDLTGLEVAAAALRDELLRARAD